MATPANDQRNLILAVALSVAIVLSFDFFYQEWVGGGEAPPVTTETAPGQTAPKTGAPAVPGATPSATAPQLPTAGLAPTGPDRAAILGADARLAVQTPELTGSIRLKGGRIDDLTLLNYNETLAPGSEPITLLSPDGSAHPYFAEFGWLDANGDQSTVPGPDSVWAADSTVLEPGKPATLSWANTAGVVFKRRLEIDAHFLLTITETVENRSDRAIKLFSYGLISRTDTPEVTGFYILHEGPLGVFNGILNETDYEDLVDDGAQTFKSTGGWAGITDKYWLTAIVPDQDQPYDARYVHEARDGRDKYQIDYRREALDIAPGATAEVTDRLFAGAKRVQLLYDYRDRLGIQNFEMAIDWGWFHFLTKPIFQVLDYLNGKLGNFGLAILLLTVLIKLVFFPLANKSYRSMSKMKLLQPKMTELKERFGEDKQGFQKELMTLYKKEGVNPLAGCLPIVIQIPVFFALYKVLFVTIEMRHAPFYGWVKDLSAADPTNILNLFGLIPWTPPEFIPALGIWPLLMGLSMFLQQKLNPAPPDPVQAKIFMLMPIIFTFLLAPFPAGLVIYWTWNNVLSIAQQWVIMKRAAAAIKKST
jgi:YidC/Oxa1 family membrane protein insertase